MKNKINLFILICATGFLCSCRNEIVPEELIPIFDSILVDSHNTDSIVLNKITWAKYLAVPFDFASNELKDTTFYNKLENMQIRYIEYVYTDFKKDKNFKQEELNRERLFNLYQQIPSLFENKEVTWKVIKQSCATNEKEASKLFHGFIIYFRPYSTKELMEKEIQYITSIIDSSLVCIKPISDSTSYATTVTTIVGIVDGGYSVTHELLSDLVDTAYTSSFGKFDYGDIFSDTVVSAVFNRNTHWKKMLINCDLTGSMSPYSAQLLVWHKLNMDKNKVQNFVYFNDGDMKPDNQKIIGKTGGIYYSTAKSFEEVQKTAFQCMSNGYGGDSPENDVEALIKSIEKFKECEDIILVADNWSNMRDISLIKSVKKPIKIILCGTQIGINIQYLELARATKGSVHTIEEDIDNLMNLKEGEEITIGYQTFRIENGKFVEILKI